MYNEEVVRVLMKRQKGIHPCFVIAVALDPRFKHMQGCGIHPNEVETIWEKVLQLMISTKTTDNENDSTVSSAEDDDHNDDDAAPVAPVNANISFLANLNFLASNINDNNNNAGAENDVEEGLQTQCEVELKLYRKSALLLTHGSNNQWNNPLEWWKNNQMKFPTVAAIAKKFLAVQATSASSERIFSRARRIVTTDRNRLDPLTVGSLLYVSENLEWYTKMSIELNYDEVANVIVPLTNVDSENEE